MTSRFIHLDYNLMTADKHGANLQLYDHDRMLLCCYVAFGTPVRGCSLRPVSMLRPQGLTKILKTIEFLAYVQNFYYIAT